MSKKLFILIIILLFSINLSAELKLPAIISDQMVLQQNTQAPIWGWASSGDDIQCLGLIEIGRQPKHFLDRRQRLKALFPVRLRFIG